MFEYFYHEILRKVVIGFGTLFNDVTVKTTDASNNVTNSVKVPLAYAPQQKFLARLDQSEDLSKTTQITLPRMSFEFTGLTYDSSRKVTTTQKILVPSPSGDGTVRKAFMPVPYNMSFELNIYTKLNDDMLQIVEQILPYFQPQYNLTVELVEEMKEKRDIPIILEGVSMDDQYEGNFESRRALIYTLRFTAKTYLFGPVAKDISPKIIKKAQVAYYASTTDGDKSNRDVTYSVVPEAVKDLDAGVITTTTVDIDKTDETISLLSISTIEEGDLIQINKEVIYVKQKSDSENKLLVRRAQNNTTATSHVSGTNVNTVDAADNALVEVGDNFGFDGEFI
jgi:hypothetical protein|tara:strand:- start:1355 stop:2368 length:1014 start_codon:yes stop_codon:yes gene_type:complete